MDWGMDLHISDQRMLFLLSIRNWRRIQVYILADFPYIQEDMNKLLVYLKHDTGCSDHKAMDYMGR